MNITGRYTCPVCLQNIRFNSRQTNINVCISCGTPLKLWATDTLASKKYPVIHENDSIIQPGTRGNFKGTNFTVLGRMRLWFKQSVYNYWTIELDDGQMGYLAEGYGRFAVYKPTSLLKTLQEFTLENTIEKALPGLKSAVSFFTQRHNEADHWEIEGEIWVPDDEEKINAYELCGDNGENIAVLFFGKQIYRAFDVTETSFDDLNLIETRQTERSKVFSCPKCHAEIILINWPYTQSCACKNCRSILEIESPNRLSVRIKGKSHQVNPTLNPGTKGEIFGTHYEVLGWVKKIEQGSTEKIYWTEYTLYHSENGYAFLSEFEGHWIFVTEFNHSLLSRIGPSDVIFWKNDRFEKYNEYRFQVIDACGEFPFSVSANGSTKAYEFIAPPQMLIVEKDQQEGVTWYYGQHIEGATIANAFGVTVPDKKGVGAIEPKGYVNQAVVILTYLKMVALALIVHLFFTFTAKEKTILQNHFSFPKAESTSSAALYDTAGSTAFDQSLFSQKTASSVQVVSKKFFLEKRKSDIEVEVGAMVRNSWFELGLTLVNAETGDEYSIEQGVEYYYGYSDGESWTEGENSKSTYLSSIPKGTYYLQVNGMREPSNNLEGFDVKVTYDVPIHRNFLMIVLLLGIWPLYKLINTYYTEKRRWENSPFTIYTYDDE